MGDRSFYIILQHDTEYITINNKIMTREDLFEMMNASPVMHLATVDQNGQPHVRGILMYKADTDGIIFHTGAMKELHQQLQANPKAEVCFNHKGVQIRVEGNFELVEDDALVEEIYKHPSRQFMRNWGSLEQIKTFLKVYRMKGGKAHAWTLADNFAPKEYINL